MRSSTDDKNSLKDAAEAVGAIVLVMILVAFIIGGAGLIVRLAGWAF